MEPGDYIKEGRPMLLFTYSTRHLPAKDKVRFYYALKGRDGKTGVVKAHKIEHVGKTVLLVPYENEADVLSFFRIWNIPYTRRKVICDREVTRGGPP